MGKKGGGGGGGENSKKAAGNARKAEQAANKAAGENAKKAAAEDEQWSKGSKNNDKKEAAAAKAAEAARKKAEKKALEDEEEASLPSRSGPKNAKTAAKKTRGLDLSQLDGDKPSALNATGIDNALDALSLTGGSKDSAKIERHPERRFKAAYAAFEERRLAEMDADGSGAGLRLKQRQDRVRKEFEKSPENPFNQVSAAHNATKEDMQQIRDQEKAKVEKNLS